MSDHKADTEALARVQAWVMKTEAHDRCCGCGMPPIDPPLLADLRRVVNLADRTADAR